MLYQMLFLLVLFQIKHFAADFPFQNEYMLGKFKERGWFLPLLTHALVHAFFTFCIVLAFGTLLALACALFDLTIHFCMDRIKASPNLMGRWKPLNAAEFTLATKLYKINHPISMIASKNWEKLRSNKYFWWALGFDQMVHHLTHYAIIAAIFLTR